MKEEGQDREGRGEMVVSSSEGLDWKIFRQPNNSDRRIIESLEQDIEEAWSQHRRVEHITIRVSPSFYPELFQPELRTYKGISTSVHWDREVSDYSTSLQVSHKGLNPCSYGQDGEGS